MNFKLHAGDAGTDSIERALAGNAEGRARFPLGLRFDGQATFQGDVAIDGEVHGILDIPDGSLLLVSATGKAEGTFRAGDARVEGAVKGEIDCSNGAVEFTQSARCELKVLYRVLSVDRGAQVEAELQQVGGIHG